MKKSKSKFVLIFLLFFLAASFYFIWTQSAFIKSKLFGIEDQQTTKIGVVELANVVLKRQPKDSLEFTQVSQGQVVYLYDTYLTGPTDSATLRLDDGTLIELSPGSLIRLNFDEQFSLSGIDRKVLVEVIQGEVEGKAKDKPILIRSKTRTVEVEKSSPQKLEAPKSQVSVTPPVVVATPTVVPPVVETPLPTPTTPEPIETKPAEAVVQPTSIPVPTPTATETPVEPLKASILLPKSGTLKVSSHEQLPLKIQTQISTDPSLKGLVLVMKDEAKKVISSTEIKIENGKANTEVMIKTPGLHELSLENLPGDKTPLTVALPTQLKIDPIIQSIKVDKPLLAGDESLNNRYRGESKSEYDMLIRWKPIKGVSEYQLVVKDAKNKVLVSTQTKETSYLYKTAKPLIGRLDYQISAKLQSGFELQSKVEALELKFLSPLATLPEDQATESLEASLKGNNKGVFFTWTKTDFTKEYLLELCASPQFTQGTYKSFKSEENFLVFKNLKPGTYYWRARSVSEDGVTVSPPRVPFKLTITP